jgi:RimJ/RimL family protein N-acetyltransferase
MALPSSDIAPPDPALSFTTARLELRHLLPCHAPFLSTLYSSPIFQEGKATPSPFSEAAALKLLSPDGVFGNVQRRFGYGQFLVSLRETATPIGTVSLMRGDFACPDIGYAILGEYNGRGYATEAARGLIAYATQHWGLHGVFAFMDPTNKRSQRVAEKIGLTQRKARRLAAFGGQTCAVWASPAMDDDLAIYGVPDDDA